ncbi:MAG: aldo/keto reductase [Anaerolineales bacterium]|jgi:aryl-alcohol dehydrogenase-like predicted oxidoreductase
MHYRVLGRTGVRVSELCLGTMQFGWTADEETSMRILNAAFKAGINFIDTANIYSRWVEGNPGGVSETIIGKWLKNSSIKRDQIIIATKVRGKMGEGPNQEGLSRIHILKAVDDSLRRLNTDYIDLYQTHWYDENTPIDETLSALDNLIRGGKVRYIGCSNYPAWRLVESLWCADENKYHSFTVLQPHYNIVHRSEFERELAGVCRRYNVAVIPYSPLAGGFLTGKYKRDSATESQRAGSAKKYFNESNWNLLDLLEQIGSEEGGLSISQTALAWLLSNDLITSPIIGPRTLNQLEDNLGAAGRQLNFQNKKLLDEASNWN